MPNTLSEAANAGIVYLLCFIITAIVIGGWRGWYRWQREVDALVAAAEKSCAEKQALKDQIIALVTADRDDWRRIAEAKIDVMERSVEVAATATRRRG